MSKELNIDAFKERADKAGYVEIESKNPYMVSFEKEENPQCRVNLYTTTGTVTVQPIIKKYDQGVVYRETNLDQFEGILLDSQ